MLTQTSIFVISSVVGYATFPFNHTFKLDAASSSQNTSAHVAPSIESLCEQEAQLLLGWPTILPQS